MIKVLVKLHLVGGTATDEEEVGIVLGEQLPDTLLAPHPVTFGVILAPSQLANINRLVSAGSQLLH